MTELEHFQREQERERLALLCALDRAHLRLRIVHARAANSPAAVLPLVRDLMQITQLFPGPIGRWSSRASLLSEVYRGYRLSRPRPRPRPAVG